MYLPGIHLTENIIRSIYQKEIMKIRLDKTYMGIWQIHALSSVLCTPIYSVYPKLGNPNVRQDLNRLILPREYKHEQPIYIFWTSTRSADMNNEHWVPNHVVPILPIDNIIIENNGCKEFKDEEREVLNEEKSEDKSKNQQNSIRIELIGFINLDQTGNSILDIEHSMKDEVPKMAKNVLVIMVRGIASNLKFPLAHFATAGITADQLFTILWEAVEILELDTGLKVLFITSDGASPNRRFIRLHANNQNGIVYRATNLYADDGRHIYFISDAPHLLKTARNCMSNSYSHKKSRQLWKNSKDISWLHIVNLFKDHCTGGLRLCPKLTRNHIDISSFGCMKVSLAAQVLSSTVANALELVYGAETSETVCFIRHMNKFFDCLNTRSLYEARNTRNENVAPYTSVDDQRLQYLVSDFWSISTSGRQMLPIEQVNFRNQKHLKCS
ncbi:THAP9 [Mytilus edulis]|uniref:THAP9 n=1 Tax=Mytilus edulis TaxID=6550 RepID=A0A8S3RQ69_MYTED|nr:THAP9 [Mytilus edulis]